MKNLLEFLLIHLVEHPEEVRIEEVETERETEFFLHVHPADMGRVIGKNGTVIEAIRKIAKIRAVKEGIRARISVAEPSEASQSGSDEAEE